MNRYLHALFVSTLLTLSLASCSVNMHTANSVVPENAKLAILDPSINLDQKTDRVTIKYLEQNGDFLMIDVSYGGGCAEHEFEIMSNGAYSATYPPELDILIFHNANGDKCRSIVDERLFFDISPYKYSGTSQIKFIIKNTDETFDYNY